MVDVEHRKRAGLKSRFHEFAVHASNLVGAPVSFFIACMIIAVWALTGPVFHFSDTWQLIINTGTTIITFLMVFLIQNTQNRDSRAMHLKLDELIRSTRSARNQLLELEEMTDDELDRLQMEFTRLRDKAAHARHSRQAHPKNLEQPSHHRQHEPYGGGT